MKTIYLMKKQWLCQLALTAVMIAYAVGNLMAADPYWMMMGNNRPRQTTYFKRSNFKLVINKVMTKHCKYYRGY